MSVLYIGCSHLSNKTSMTKRWSPDFEKKYTLLSPCTSVDTGFSWYPESAVQAKLKTRAWWRHQMETFSALLALCEGNPTVTRASDAELWCVLSSAPEQTAKQTIGTLVIWDAIALIMTSLKWVSLLFVGSSSHNYNAHRYYCCFY